MGQSGKLVWKIYVGVLGGVTTIVAQKLVSSAWKMATGEKPPSPTDPRTPVGQAITWALASGIGVGVTQLVIARMAARRWSEEMGSEAPGIPHIKLRI